MKGHQTEAFVQTFPMVQLCTYAHVQSTDFSLPQTLRLKPRRKQRRGKSGLKAKETVS